MKQEAEMKPKMYFDEMAEAFAVENPYFIPNKNNVGRFARGKGYIRAKQVINHKQIYFYIKPQD